MVSPSGSVSTLAGATTPCVGGAVVDGMGTQACFGQGLANGPIAIAMDAGGNLFVTDPVNARVRKITPAGNVSTLAGASSTAGIYADGLGSQVSFANITGLSVDSVGIVFVLDSSRIRRISPQGFVTSLAGGFANPPGPNQPFNLVDGRGTQAAFNFPIGLTVNGNGLFGMLASKTQCEKSISSKFLP